MNFKKSYWKRLDSKSNFSKSNSQPKSKTPKELLIKDLKLQTHNGVQFQSNDILYNSVEKKPDSYNESITSKTGSTKAKCKSSQTSKWIWK